MSLMASGSEWGSASTFEMTGIRGAFSCVLASASLHGMHRIKSRSGPHQMLNAATNHALQMHGMLVTAMQLHYASYCQVR